MCATFYLAEHLKQAIFENPDAKHYILCGSVCAKVHKRPIYKGGKQIHFPLGLSLTTKEIGKRFRVRNMY